jgi:serine/threonine-protein kinase
VDRLNAALEGRYRIEREIGAGGMATVYLAEDIKHKRNVAIKVLRPELAAVIGGERFLSEIETTANLQHPHILPLFDSGEADSFLFFVMPFIEGETLRDRLDREKQLPVEEAVGIAVNVASALQVAHEKGIVHRDIKPGNILISQGQPLVADFGIALAVGSAGGNRLTDTPYYMSPEQATGDQVVGPQSDTFALASVLYEMLIGEPPYAGNTAQAVLGKIIQGVPVSATAVRRSVPPNVDAAIRKALEKLPADRFSRVSDFARALGDRNFSHGDMAASGAAGRGSGAWKMAALGAGAVAVAMTGLFALTAFSPSPAAPVQRFALAPAEGQDVNYHFDLSDDGRIAVLQIERGDGPVLAVQREGDLDPAPIPGTQGGLFPAISPDGTEVAFVEGAQVKVAPLVGGVVRTLTDSATCCLSWGRDGFLYYSNLVRVTKRVSVSGGPSESITERQDGEAEHGSFEILPGTDVGVFTVWGNPTRVVAKNVVTGDRKDVSAGVKPFFTSDGYLVFGSMEGQILAAPFDPSTLELAGPAVPLVEGVRVDSDRWPFYSLSLTGDLVYWTGASNAGAEARVVRVDRDGEVKPIDPDWVFDPGASERALSLSPDGSRIAVKRLTEAGEDIWVKQLDDGPFSRLTFDPEADWRPWWSPDGEWVYFISWRGGDLDLFRKRADGTGGPEVILDQDGHVAEAQLTPDGQWMILRLGGSTGGLGLRDLAGMHVGAGDSTLVPLAAEPYDEAEAAISPDGRWLAYKSTETGRDEVYIRPFPEVDQGKWQISTQGAYNPVWAHSGRELFYVRDDGDMVVAELSFDCSIRANSACMPSPITQGGPSISTTST